MRSEPRSSQQASVLTTRNVAFSAEPSPLSAFSHQILQGRFQENVLVAELVSIMNTDTLVLQVKTIQVAELPLTKHIL